jgi:hypothetical protein
MCLATFSAPFGIATCAPFQVSRSSFCIGVSPPSYIDGILVGELVEREAAALDDLADALDALRMRRNSRAISSGA